MSSPTHKNLSALVEQPNSDSRVNGQTNTRTKIYIAEYDVAVAAQKTRGTIGTGDLAGWVIDTSSVESLRGEIGRLTDVWSAGEGSGATLPPDEIAVSATNQSPKTERNPHFLALTAAEFKKVDDAIRAPTAELRAPIYNSLGALGKSLVDKIVRGNETYYHATLRYSWATHSYTLPTMYRGGWIESPGGPLAGYFVGDISWLREADDLQYNAGVWRLTRSWLGASNFAWDTDLYN